jgi:hypothetical protein
MTHADIEKAASSSLSALGFDALTVPATRRSAHSVWSDAFALTDGRFAVTIGNLAGTPAAAAALLLAIRESVKSGPLSPEPGALLRVVEAVFRRPAASDGAAATAIVGIIDFASHTFTYVSAGHAPPFVRYADGAVAALPADGSPIGSIELDHPRAEIVVDLRGAALVVLYSGTLIHATGDVEDGLRRLTAVLVDERIAHCDNPSAWIARRVLGDCAHDDVALLAVNLSGRRAGAGRAPDVAPPRWSVSWAFDATGPASTGARRAFLRCLDEKTGARPAIDVAAAELIFGELLGNVVRHAPGLVEITLDWTGEFPVLHVLDNGPGFRSRRSRERLPVDDLSESGRGLFIVNACATKFSVRNRNGRGTHASATLPPA